jgi:hypothetical protein
MRLTDLAPRWVLPANWADSSEPMYVGVSFLCPHCLPAEHEGRGPGKRQRLTVMFWPHIDPSNLRGKYGEGWFPQTGKVHDRVSGESFETLTLSPSVGFESIGHWHGHIINGEVTSS